MTDAAFIAIYGLLFISGCFMLHAWGGIWLRARHAHDRDYTLVAGSLALNSIGTILVFGAVLLFGWQTSNWNGMGGAFGRVVLIGLGFFEASKTGLMFVRYRHGKIKTWRWFAVLSAAWAVGAIGWGVL